MVAWLLHCALAGTPAVEDRADAWYLWDTGRWGPAQEWLRDQAEAHPDDAEALYSWLLTASYSLEGRTAVLPQLIEGWAVAHPDAGLGGVVVALAHGVSAYGPHAMGPHPWPEAGPWCAPARAALGELPEGGRARYLALRTRVDVERACGGDADGAGEAMRAYARTGEGGPYALAAVGPEGGYTQADVDAIAAALDEEPARLRSVLRAFRDDASGEALEAARALLIARARELAGSDRPSHVYAAVMALNAAHLDDELRAAVERLKRLDPDNGRVDHLVAPKSAPPPPDEAPAAETLFDPAERLAAMGDRPPKDRWEAQAWWPDRVAMLQQLGRDDEALAVMDEWWRKADGIGSNKDFARAAAAAGQRLKAAARAADVAVRYAEWGPHVFVGYDTAEEAWRRALADAYDVRALVAEARGRPHEAREDLERALQVAPRTADRCARLGLAYADWGAPEQAHPLLGWALAEGGLDPELDTRARDVLERALRADDTFLPGGVDAYVAAWAARAASQLEAAPDAPVAPFDLAAVEVSIDGETRTLASFDGPLVVDVWATWCGPCTRSLPHLEALARQYGDAVTFVAVSVDDTPDRAAAYLERRGGAAFVAAHAPGGMKSFGVSGIPAMFVFDAEHRLVDRVSGWGPGSTALEDAVGRLGVAAP